MIKATFKLEEEFLSKGYKFIIGIDEVGRGPLAGPVVACAASIRTSDVLFGHPMSKEFELIRDSKMLSEKQRESLFDFIAENFYVGVGICDHRTIDRINILEASFLAMKSAVSQLKSKIKNLDNSKLIILLDGNKKIPNFSFEQRAIVSGDKIVKSISAASIYAKVTRDRMMGEMHKIYPEYNFAQHKGYGTKIHMDALKKHGPCEIHRKSFRPVRKCMV
ncbi:MAG: ribonuclease HII [Candidatus Moranbacteria bacterium RIFOXYA12_FULL_35_19]|nr:MAG: Ribonuclease HII [Candidatus Moranbacteria bacterium GW2011_GWF2_35_39]OGI35732.1 MAG: ribonuclease HII [Candidatus Moranbacteria bacterium RIFOXYA12_FULL_35_19]